MRECRWRRRWEGAKRVSGVARRHAALVAGDRDINPLFVRECWVDGHHPPSRFCVSDEHYVPTLLAAHGAPLYPPFPLCPPPPPPCGHRRMRGGTCAPLAPL